RVAEAEFVCAEFAALELPPGSFEHAAASRDEFRTAPRRDRHVRAPGGPRQLPVDTWAAMSCRFDMPHYRELLEAAKAGGYDWASFDRHPRPRDLFLRHDVDLSLEAALELARVEHELGVRATYFLM